MEHLIEPIRPYGMLLAGGVFGAGWWAWCDVLLRSCLVLHTKVSPLYCIPGIVATIAVILMATISREDTDSYIGFGDDGEQCRTKCGLFIAYVAAFGSIAGAVVILLLLKQQGGDLMIGVGAVCQTAIICLSGLLTWLCKSSEGSDYSLLGW
ncbi:hypothetical protein COO60DRAFT_1582182 [Scenedesmus sp. NREL 46B-D3]|nr:hypothetical protein COO60DRAFT_1588574 [Scenedesmus sp. NREL 46B-D3]KAF6249262.1 hypothetical protein COO60DRAFT_1582182 [Scenedesmus sp. NREL 46B-D3]